MADEKIFKDEKLTDEELDGVAGGDGAETIMDGNALYVRGLLSENDILNFKAVQEIIHKMGYTGYEYKVRINDRNIYTDKQGNKITREQFWKNFDAENKGLF